MSVPFPDHVRALVEATTWTFAKTYASTWPHEYVVRRYYHEAGQVYWSMDPTPETTVLVNRCEESETYEARLSAGSLPET